MKPRIKWLSYLKVWCCYGGSYYGIGGTPRMAYHKWDEDRV